MPLMTGSRRLAWFLVLALSACAGLPAPETVTTEYVCANGAGFRLETAGDVTAIEISGMRFRLREQPGIGGETDYVCDMLTLTRNRDAVRVEMDGRPYLDQCRSTR